MSVLSCFGLCVNSLVAVFPRSAVVQVTKEVQNFGATQNHLAGTLPERGMQAMLALSTFHLAQNSFTGTLPESGPRE
eukprot:696977-Amphidinium_carterae.3